MKHLLCRAVNEIWQCRLKEMFCVDSSVDMNNLALALLRGGNKTDPGVENEAVPGLFFRQFLPTSSTVRLNSLVNYHTIIYYV